MSIRRFEASDHAENYRKFRPSYPDSLHETILEYMCARSARDECGTLNRENVGGAKLSLAVDVGCGSGQALGHLVHHFDRILGFDVSPAQIEQAINNNPHKNVEYRVSDAENLPVEDACVDLLIAGMALHWFDHDKFYKEVDRILRPGGVVAVYMYSIWIDVVDHPRQTDLSSCIREMMEVIRDKKCYWPEQCEYLVRGYTDKELQIPYSDCVRDESMYLTVNTTIDGLFKYLKTGSVVLKYLQANGENGMAWWRGLIQRFCEIYGSEDKTSAVTYKIDVVLLMGRKPT